MTLLLRSELSPRPPLPLPESPLPRPLPRGAPRLPLPLTAAALAALPVAGSSPAWSATCALREGLRALFAHALAFLSAARSRGPRMSALNCDCVRASDCMVISFATAKSRSALKSVQGLPCTSTVQYGFTEADNPLVKKTIFSKSDIAGMYCSAFLKLLWYLCTGPVPCVIMPEMSACRASCSLSRTSLST